MMGRGLVHPLDLEHSGNPAVHSQLLALVTDELVRMKFDAKAFLRQLALTRAYQRSSQTPAAEELKFDPAATTQAIAAWKAEAERLLSELAPLETASNASIVELNAAYEKFSKSAIAREAAEKSRAEAKKAVDDLAAALAADLKSVSEKEDILRSLIEARDKAQAAAAKLPGDKAIADAAGQLNTRAERNRHATCRGAQNSRRKGTTGAGRFVALGRGGQGPASRRGRSGTVSHGTRRRRRQVASGTRTIPHDQSAASRVDSVHRQRAGDPRLPGARGRGERFAIGRRGRQRTARGVEIANSGHGRTAPRRRSGSKSSGRKGNCGSRASRGGLWAFG